MKYHVTFSEIVEAEDEEYAIDIAFGQFIYNHTERSDSGTALVRQMEDGELKKIPFNIFLEGDVTMAVVDVLV